MTPTTILAIAAGVVGAGATAVFAAGIVAGVLVGDSAGPTLLPGWSAGEIDAVLARWGLPSGSVVAYLLAWELVTCASGLAASALLLRRPRSGFRVYVALVLVLHTTLGGSAPALLAAAVPGAGWLTALTGVGWLALFTMVVVFPDGRFVPRWTRWTLPAWAALFAALLASPERAPGPPIAIALIALLAIGAGAQLHRYRRVSDAQTRLQTRWVLVALGLRLALVAAVAIVRTLEPVSARTAPSLALELAMTGASHLVSALLALAIAVAALRHRLFGVDVVVSRALVYGALSAFVLLVYAVVVGGVGLLWSDAGGAVLPVLATAVAAASLLPVRAWLQRRVARLVLGARAEPYRIVRELGARLTSMERPEELMRAVVETVGPALGLERAEVRLEPAGDARRTIAAFEPSGRSPGARPDGAERTEVFPVAHRGRRVGALEVRARRDAPLSPADRELLAAVAGQAALALVAARDAEDLRAARDAAVGVREEERRRLQRDLHDGLGPTLASVYQRVELASRLVDSDPAACRRLLVETGRQLRETVADIRRLVHALRPPRLAELGLVEAVAAAADELSVAGGARIVVRRGDVLPELPAAVETTAYRIALEAMTNVVRHAKASGCVVELRAVPEGPGAGDGIRPAGPLLAVTVRDDGSGMPEEVVPGAGLRSLAERAAEVGGRLTVEAAEPSGTVVTARIPLPPGALGAPAPEAMTRRERP